MKNPNKFWNNQAKNYNTSDNKETMELLRQSVKYIGSDDIVLDFACGTGDSTVGISKHVKEVIGIDISEEMIKYANLKAEKEQLNNVSFKTTTLEACEFKNESFDVIFAFNILHLVDDLSSTMEKVNHLLKPNGIFVSNTACLGDDNNFTSRLIKFVSKFAFLPSITSYSCIELEEAICTFGFNTLESGTVNDTVPSLYLAVKKNSDHSY